MDRIPEGFADDVAAQLVRGEIQRSNRAVVRALITAAYAGEGPAPDFIGVTRSTLQLFAEASPRQLDAVYQVGLPLWDFTLSGRQLNSVLTGSVVVRTFAGDPAAQAVPQLVLSEVQKANKAIIKALVTASRHCDGLTPELIGVPPDTLDLLARVKQSQLDPIDRIPAPLWVFRFATPAALARSLLDGEIGAMAMTHRFLAGFNVGIPQ
ncbi:hypothetical protein [Cupriavidus sp. CuC1]|uniref:hypothetical protein n=1 Tax=Cupriavidus sp. CuC1 TaxID=3373131 RepID=UPI0037D4B180